MGLRVLGARTQCDQRYYNIWSSDKLVGVCNIIVFSKPPLLSGAFWLCPTTNLGRFEIRVNAHSIG
eukprot:830792-Amphidinium_carterae.1